MKGMSCVMCIPNLRWLVTFFFLFDLFIFSISNRRASVRTSLAVSLPPSTKIFI